MRAPGAVLAASLVSLGLGAVSLDARADAGTGAHAEEDHGLAVLGIGSAVDVTWPLARSVYADAALRPAHLDEAHARVLVGEVPPEGASAELRDLADTRLAVHGDDAASRRLLQSIAIALHVKGIVVVEPGATATARPSARVFVTTSTAFDPVHYDPDPAAPVTWGSGSASAVWSGAVTALHRGFGDAPAPAPPPPPPAPTSAPAKHIVPAEGISIFLPNPLPAPDKAAGDKGQPAPRAFYQSPWFWAAAGAALFAAGAVYLATRNDGSDNIQLQVQVPK